MEAFCDLILLALLLNDLVVVLDENDVAEIGPKYIRVAHLVLKHIKDFVLLLPVLLGNLANVVLLHEVRLEVKFQL